jgi:hypothetical protein
LGTLSIVLGIIGICIGWLPVLGWSGMLLGISGCVLGVLSITHWHAKSGYTGWGISGVVLGVTSGNLALAYQIKHAGGALDGLYVPLSAPAACGLFGGAGLIAALGIVLARKGKRSIGLALAGIAITALILSGAWGLTTVDREMEGAVVSDSP